MDAAKLLLNRILSYKGRLEETADYFSSLRTNTARLSNLETINLVSFYTQLIKLKESSDIYLQLKLGDREIINNSPHLDKAIEELAELMRIKMTEER